MGAIKTVTVFADSGVTAHQAEYRKAGAAIAKRGAALICVAREGDWPQALTDAALAAGGKVTVVSSDAQSLKVPQGVTTAGADSERAAGEYAVELGDAVIGLPGGIATTAMLYAAWTDAGGADSGKPVGLLNHQQSFEIVRGFIADVAQVGRGNTDRLIQISESFEDLWTRLSRLV